MFRSIILICMISLLGKSYGVIRQSTTNMVPNINFYSRQYAENVTFHHDYINPNVIGGDESIPHSRPYQAAIFIPITGGNNFCGGSLINVHTVLTAAHCFDGFHSGLVTLILGAHTIAYPEPSHQTRYCISTNIIIHPGWSNATLQNDIALIHIPQPFEINEYVMPIQLPRNTNDLYIGNVSLITGWGQTNDSNIDTSTVLREVSLPVISTTLCRMAYIGIVNESYHICTSGVRGSTCKGDNGGPLIINGVQIGIVSFRSTFGCNEGWPTVYTRVSAYLGWIEENLDKNYISK